MARLSPEARRELVSNRRAQIIKAALDLAARQGFAATSMEDVARAAQLGKGTVYLYFPTKEALLEALFESQSMLGEIAPMLEHLRPDSTIEEIVERAVPYMWNLLHSRRQALAVLLREGTHDAGYGALFIKRMLPFNEMLASMLATRIGPARAQRVDPYVAIRALVAMMIGLFVEHEILGGNSVRPVDPEVLTKSVAELFLRGVCGPASADHPP